MKIIVDKQSAIKAVCDAYNIKYSETFFTGKGVVISLINSNDEIIFDFEKEANDDATGD